MTLSSYTALLDFAVETAQQAGSLIRQRFGTTMDVAYKGAVDPVTATDKQAEAIIIGRLRAAYPDHLIHGEESGGSHWHTSQPIWLIDPLDGTNNFAHNFPHICVSMGLMDQGEYAVGVVYDPLRDETFAAYRGGGAQLNGSPIHVSDVNQLSRAFLAAGFPYVRRTAVFNNARMVDHFLRRSQGVRRAGSAALDMAYVACGRFDGFWEPSLHPWDLAAGVLLVTEAGGRVSDFSGGLTRLGSGDEVLVSNGWIHQAMLDVLRDEAAAPHPDFPPLS
ncbi:MAG: inositol monophosphatase family protein [Anaerolineae bacterium]|nr:inositol monophosphatase family protein [Anaerolineae bacterium]